MPIYNRLEETVGIALNQTKARSVFVAHEHRIYLREVSGNFSYTTGFGREKSLVMNQCRKITQMDLTTLTTNSLKIKTKSELN